LIFSDYGCNGTAAKRGFYEVVTVEALTFYREKKFAGLHGARVDGISLRDCAWVVFAGGGDKLGDS
jgi:hypothetical protein